MDCPVNPSDSQVRILDFDFPTSLFMERVLPINLSVSESYELASGSLSPGFRERIIIKNLLNIEIQTVLRAHFPRLPLVFIDMILVPWKTTPEPPVMTRFTGTPVSGSLVRGGSVIFC